MIIKLIQLVSHSHLSSRKDLTNEPTEKNCVRLQDDASKIICTCDKTNCDGLEFDWPSERGEARLVETTKSGRRFRSTTLNFSKDFEADESSSISVIGVDLAREQQTIIGFGGAFTDAAAININSLSKPVRDKLLASYFGPTGLQYSFGRVPIAGSDFSTRAYSYDDANFIDYELKEWRLASEDLDHKIPVIKRALELAEDTAPKLKLFASPWSPPTWMKTSRSFERGHLIDDDRVYRAYANYLIKFYKAYRQNGIAFWGATVQNEPVAAYLPFYFFNSLQMSASETRRFVVDHLGPALEAEGFNKRNFKLMIGDDSLLFVNQMTSLLDDFKVQKYVSGLGFHWYTSALLAPYSSLSKLTDSVKGKVDFVMMTEACNGAMTLWGKHVDLGSWDRGESYATDIIEDFRRQTNAWIDWNLALDEQGGPNWSGNFVDSPIIVNKDKDEFYKQPMYYALAHFSRFLRPNSVILASELENQNYFEKLMILAARNEETDHLIINILNTATSARKLQLKIKTNTTQGGELLSQSLGPFQVEGKSINTLVLKL